MGWVIPPHHRVSRCRRGIALLALILFLLTLAFGVYDCLPKLSGENCHWDAFNTYRYCIKKEVVTNWHSELLLYECIGLRHAVKALFGFMPVDMAPLLWVWWLLFSLSVVSIAALLMTAAYGNAVYAAASLPAGIIYAAMVRDTPLGLDFCFNCLTVITVVLTTAFVTVRGSRKKLLLCVLILFAAWHLISFRRNAVFLLPLLFFFLLAGVTGLRSSRIRRVAASILVSVIFAGITLPLVSLCLPVCRMYPVYPMMESDERISLILTGEQHTAPRHVFRSEKYTEDTIAGAAGGRSVNKTNRDNFVAYARLWKERPLRMMTAKTLQIIQFYCSGYTPPIVRAYVEKQWPAVAANPLAWQYPKVFVDVSPARASRRVAVLASGMVLLPVLHSRYRRCRKPGTGMALSLATAASVYAAAYLVVTPTPDIRYTSMSEMLILMVWTGMAANLCGRLFRKQTAPAAGTDAAD